jgi:hypothetical protein
MKSRKPVTVGGLRQDRSQGGTNGRQPVSDESPYLTGGEGFGAGVPGHGTSSVSMLPPVAPTTLFWQPPVGAAGAAAAAAAAGGTPGSQIWQRGGDSGGGGGGDI